MDAQEIQGHEKVSSNWVKNLKSTVNKINNAMSSMINRKPIDAIKLNIVELDKSETRADNNVLPEDGLDRYLYEPGEKHGCHKKRAIGFIWSKNTCRLDQIVKEPGNGMECLYLKIWCIFQRIIKYLLIAWLSGSDR